MVVALSIAVDEGQEAHGSSLLGELREGAGLIAVSLREGPSADEVRAGRHMKLGVHRDHDSTGSQCGVDHPGGMQDIATAFDDDRAFVDQLIEGVGEQVWGREVDKGAEIPAGQHAAHDGARERRRALGGQEEPAGDETRARDSDGDRVSHRGSHSR
jgi:hypothetical protein